jgi:serine protease Do
LLPQLERHGRVQRGFLGASVQDLSDDQLEVLAGAVERGAYVASVEESGPAAAAGLLPGDVIVGVDGESVDGAAGLTRSVALLEPGLQVEVVFVRGLATLQTRVVLGERPGRSD